MNQTSKAKAYNIASLVCALWFLLTAAAWTYLANLLISFPIGLIAYLLRYQGKRLNPASRLPGVVSWILIAGLIWSAIAFCLFYFNVW